MGSARGHVGTQGPAPLTAQRQEFGRLIAKGVNNSEACRLVGVNRRTGTRWRFGRTVTSGTGSELHYAPVAEGERLALPIESPHAALLDQLLKSLFGHNTARKNLAIDHALYLQESFRPMDHSDLPTSGKSRHDTQVDLP